MTRLQRTAMILSAIDADSTSAIIKHLSEDEVSLLKTEMSAIKSFPEDLDEHLNCFFELCLLREIRDRNEEPEEYDPNKTFHRMIINEDEGESPYKNLINEIKEFVQKHSAIAAYTIRNSMEIEHWYYGYMEKRIIETIKKLPEMESLTPASFEQIEEIENKLNLEFAYDYREYLEVFGAVCSDIIAISGISDDPYINVLDLTLKARLANEQIPLNFYVIEDAGVDGLIIWQDKTSAIYQSIPSSAPEIIHNNLSDYLEYVMEGL
jgi:hypothetical protein